MAIKLLPPRPGNGNYRIRGKVRGRYINEATGTSDRGRAEVIRIKRERELLDESVLGARVSRTFAQAARDYVEKENPRGTQRHAVIGRRRRDGTRSPPSSATSAIS
jgi:spore coat polysaccharide biosynthesis protein SpsF (cytidylyltransferase family)